MVRRFIDLVYPSVDGESAPLADSAKRINRLARVSNHGPTWSTGDDADRVLRRQPRYRTGVRAGTVWRAPSGRERGPVSGAFLRLSSA